MKETNHISTNEEIKTSPPQPPPLPPPPKPQPQAIVKEDPLKIILPENLNGIEVEKCFTLIPRKPVTYVPFVFTFKNQNSNLKTTKAIISSKWTIDGENIDKLVHYSNSSSNITFIPQKEHSNKELIFEIKISPLIFDLENKSNIFSKLFNKSSSNNETPIIIEYKHKILFEKGRELLKINESSSNNNNNNYRIIQYNILADCYVSDSWYSDSPSYSLRWNSYRSFMLIEQILQYSADIVGTQEVDRLYWQLFKEMNVRGGYEYFPSYSNQETPQTKLGGFDNRYREGCFIFFKKDRFTLLNGLEIDYTKLRHPDQKLLDKAFIEELIQDPIYKFCIDHFLVDSSHHVHHALVLLQDKHNKQKMIVVSKHMYWGAQDFNYQIQCVQIQLFTKILSRFIEVNKLENNIPIMVCGDFNSSPDDSCYNFMVKGLMTNDDHNLTLGGKYPPAFSSPHFKNIPEFKSIEHSFNFLSAYSQRPDGEPKFTIVSKAFTGNIDQIFVSKDRFKVNSVLEIGEKQDYKLLPSLILASDHILLMSDLELQQPPPPSSP
ncbi:hypothetical protein RB653_008973 [Dictyostelium firmibasis]|uniref:Endonuclease/exonuclease/phosphatase domain-containing protein n=1 Tax=Dictyostelium firmibasis TaxID=79012 RepID=A0AAN7YX06_9MYCE